MGESRIQKCSERDVQQSVLRLLKALGMLAFRMNSGAFTFQYKGKRRFFRAGTPGMADILAFFDRQSWSVGGKTYHMTRSSEIPKIFNPSPVWIECKAPHGRQSRVQKLFQQMVEREGHIYVLAHSAQELHGRLVIIGSCGTSV